VFGREHSQLELNEHIDSEQKFHFMSAEEPAGENKSAS